MYLVFLTGLMYPRDIKILGWCPVGLVLWGGGASSALVGYPSSDGVTIKIPYGVDILLHRPALHPIFSYWAD